MQFVQYLQPTQMEILQTLQQAHVIVKENYKTCGNDREWDGWTHTVGDPNNPYNHPLLTICTDTLINNYLDSPLEINRTLTHESMHVVQACRGKNRYLFSEGNIEREAFSVQDNPDKVLTMLKKFCF